jgi:hypothetical protein
LEGVLLIKFYLYHREKYNYFLFWIENIIFCGLLYHRKTILNNLIISSLDWFFLFPNSIFLFSQLLKLCSFGGISQLCVVHQFDHKLEFQKKYCQVFGGGCSYQMTKNLFMLKVFNCCCCSVKSPRWCTASNYLSLTMLWPKAVSIEKCYVFM